MLGFEGVFAGCLQRNHADRPETSVGMNQVDLHWPRSRKICCTYGDRVEVDQCRVALTNIAAPGQGSLEGDE